MPEHAVAEIEICLLDVNQVFFSAENFVVPAEGAPAQPTEVESHQQKPKP